MFGVGWTEMLLIGVVALVVIGPKDLPVVMNRLGKVVATIRRMGNEFQQELNKTTGLDQLTDLRRSITEPLKQRRSSNSGSYFDRRTRSRPDSQDDAADSNPANCVMTSSKPRSPWRRAPEATCCQRKRKRMNSAAVTGSISRRNDPIVRRWMRASSRRWHHSTGAGAPEC